MLDEMAEPIVWFFRFQIYFYRFICMGLVPSELAHVEINKQLSPGHWSDYLNADFIRNFISALCILSFTISLLLLKIGSQKSHAVWQ